MKKNEANYVHMFSIDNIIPCMDKLSSTMSITLDYETIENSDEEIVKPSGQGFIRLYHHFIYPSPGVVNCKYVKGVGDYKSHSMIKKVCKMSFLCLHYYF